MRTLFSALTTIAFAAASTAALATTSKECDKGRGTCQVKITITACDANGKATGTVTPDAVHVDKGTWQIRWTLSGATFTANGVQFPTNKPRSGGGKVFEDKKKVDATHFRWKDTNEQPDKDPFKYTTEVTFKGKTCTLDPDVSND